MKIKARSRQKQPGESHFIQFGFFEFKVSRAALPQRLFARG